MQETIPKSFREKLDHFLQYLYKNGGRDLEHMEFISSRDQHLAFASDQREFKRIMKYLHDENLIVCTPIGLSAERTVYKFVTLTKKGIKEAEKELPKIPMIGLVNQVISTGDSSIDKRINHAKKLFFASSENIENMRSACVELSSVLEPLREDCKKYFGKKDTQIFFDLVNRFDIRHNKEKTMNIEYPEQLEWVFYSLFNTINAYTKIKARVLK